MIQKSAFELRAAAERYRALALEEGGDTFLLVGLLAVADEFAREAAEVDARPVG